MTETKILLNSVDKVKSFTRMISKYPCDCEIICDKYIVDAKSIMGIFSLDLTKTLTLRMHSNDIDMLPIRDYAVGNTTQM